MVCAILPEYYVRKVTLDDLKYSQQAVDIFNSAYGNNSSGWANLNKTVDNHTASLESVEEIMKESLQNEKVIQLFAFKRDEHGNDEQVVGVISVEVAPFSLPHPLPEDEGMLGRFAIRPDLQSKGLGRLIIDSALEEMKNVGYKCCSILVFEHRESLLNWYRKLGFVDTNEFYPYVPTKESTLLVDVKFALLKKKL